MNGSDAFITGNLANGYNLVNLTQKCCVGTRLNRQIRMSGLGKHFSGVTNITSVANC